MGKLDGRVAIVTGAAQGIGQAEAIRLAEEGADVAVVDLRATACEDTVAAIRGLHRKANAYEVDVTNSDAVNSMVDQVNRDLGPVGILVNNAGITRDNLVFRMSDDDWFKVIQTHLTGSFYCTRAAQASMVQQRWGKIVYTSSTSALGNRGQINYSTAKAGLQGMTRTMAVELGPFNINVNAVAPGFIDTEMTRATARRIGRDPEEVKAERAQNIPLRRVGVPRDIANVVTFLCTDEASFVTGQVIYISGSPGRA